MCVNLADSGAAVNGSDAATASIESNGVGEKKLDESARDADKKASEIDWDRYIENHAMQAPMPGGIYRGSGDELPSWRRRSPRPEDLVDHIAWQVPMSDFREDEQRFAALVLGNLDDRRLPPIDGQVPGRGARELAEEAEIDVEDAERPPRGHPDFDPVGVAARDLRECLLVQARHFGSTSS